MNGEATLLLRTHAFSAMYATYPLERRSYKKSAKVSLKLTFREHVKLNCSLEPGFSDLG
jgi:hypothetical protein